MASEKKRPSGIPATPSTIAFLAVCAVLIVLVVSFTLSGFFGASNQTQTAGLASAANSPTAALVDDAPTIPPPTGPLPPKRATFDINQLYTVPTRALAPGETPLSTNAINPNSTYVVPTFPPLNPLAPDAKWATYHDPNLGLSFQYPSNWHIDVIINGPPGPEYTDITIRNYDLVLTKGNSFTPDLMKIEIQASPDFAQYGTLDLWYLHYLQSLRDPDNLASNPSFPDLQHMNINNVPAIRWTDIGARAVVLGKGKWLYSIAAYPDYSRFSVVFDRFLSTFQIP